MVSSFYKLYPTNFLFVWPEAWQSFSQTSVTLVSSAIIILLKSLQIIMNTANLLSLLLSWHAESGFQFLSLLAEADKLVGIKCEISYKMHFWVFKSADKIYYGLCGSNVNRCQTSFRSVRFTSGLWQCLWEIYTFIWSYFWIKQYQKWTLEKLQSIFLQVIPLFTHFPQAEMTNA